MSELTKEQIGEHLDSLDVQLRQLTKVDQVTVLVNLVARLMCEARDPDAAVELFHFELGHLVSDPVFRDGAGDEPLDEDHVKRKWVDVV